MNDYCGYKKCCECEATEIKNYTKVKKSRVHFCCIPEDLNYRAVNIMNAKERKGGREREGEVEREG